MIQITCDGCKETGLTEWYLVETTFQRLHDKTADDTTVKIYCETCAEKKGIL